MNSNYYENYGGGYRYDEDGAFKQIVDFLKLNPKFLKEKMIERNFNVCGTYRNLSSRNGKELVSYDEFITELDNNSCNCSQLTFVGMVDLKYFIGKYDEKPISVIIPKGNSCGLFSQCQGGGSTIECELLKDVEIKLNRPHGKTEYDVFQFLVDKQNSYSIDEAYGVTREFWGKEVVVKF